MPKREKAFVVPPRSLFDIVATNDLTQLCISVKGFNPNDTSPGNLLLSSKQRPSSSDGASTMGSTAKGTVAAITANMVSFERDAGGFTTLHIAAAHGHFEMVKVLVEEYHCDVNATSDSGKSPLYLAVEQGHEDIVEYFLHHGAELRTLTRDDKKSIFTIAFENQHHRIAVALEHALRMSGYSTSDRDPVEAALDGDVFYFVFEKARIEAAKIHAPTDTKLFTRVAYAQDAAKNSLFGSIALQRHITNAQIEVVRYLIENKLHGEINGTNSMKNTALHNLCISCGEKDFGPNLETRVTLFKLLVGAGADVRRQNSQGSTPIQCTEHPIMKLFLLAEEKRHVFLDVFVKRNQVPVNDRPAFAAKAKGLKKDWRTTEANAHAAMSNPKAVATPGSSPKQSARGTAPSASLKIQVLSAKDLHPLAGNVSCDPFVQVLIGGAEKFKTSVASQTTAPEWPDASFVVSGAADGLEVEFHVYDKDIVENRLLGTATVTLTKQLLTGQNRSTVSVGRGSVTIAFVAE